MQIIIEAVKFRLLNENKLERFSLTTGYSWFRLRAEGSAEAAAKTFQPTDSRRGESDTGKKTQPQYLRRLCL